MAVSDFFRISRQTRILILILVCLASAGFLVAYLYYSYQNKSEDPRVTGARLALIQYDNFIKERNYQAALQTLDTVKFIYDRIPGYRNSFEYGVIYNNRGSVYLYMAIYDSLVPQDEKETLLRLAEESLMKSIEIYRNWIDSLKLLSPEIVKQTVSRQFSNKDPGLRGSDLERIIDKRVKDIENARIETPRRLSVSFTNLGIIHRHQLRQQEAAGDYLEAMKLWKDNHTARSNFNVLMGKPPEDRSILDKLFPPERLKQD